MDYDYVIVGAGSAGCVIARRLIERTDATVLLLEAGGTDTRERVRHTDIASMTSMWGDQDYVWPCVTSAQPGLAGRRIPLPQGRLVGGGSSVNAMMYVRGNHRDFDGWQRQGNDGWSAADVLPYFTRSEDYVGGADAHRGAGGPLGVVGYDRPSGASRAFVEAVQELGLAAYEGDYNGARQEGVAFYYQSTRTKDNERCGTGTAFLGPVLADPRLTLVTGAQAERIVVERGRAVGVDYRLDGAPHRDRAGAEVIVSAGALATPKLLMLSGIGPAHQLRAWDIAPLCDLPGVGRNLQDHLLVGVAYESRQDLPFPELLAEAGLITSSADAAGAAGEDPDPDLQFFFGPVQFVDDRYKSEGPGFTFAPILLQPRSRGTVTLASGRPDDLPVIDPHYLEDAADLEVLVRGVEMSRRIAAASAFTPFAGRELAPGASAGRAEIAEYVRQNASTVWHPVGTCRMGVDDDAVVDPGLHVYGVTGLRVADASVMPTITRGNTNATAIMIGEKAADLIAPAR